MNASRQEPTPPPQVPHVCAPDEQPAPARVVVVTHDTPHDEHGHEEPGYGHGV